MMLSNTEYDYNRVFHTWADAKSAKGRDRLEDSMGLLATAVKVLKKLIAGGSGGPKLSAF